MLNIFQKLQVNFDWTVKFIEIVFLILGTMLVVWQLRESNRLNWLSSLEVRANDLSKMEIENKPLQCIYNYGNKDIDLECKKIINDINNQREIILYLDELLDLHLEVIKYDIEYSIPFIGKENEFNKYYKEWYNDVFEDNTIKTKFYPYIHSYKIDIINKYIKETQSKDIKKSSKIAQKTVYKKDTKKVIQFIEEPSETVQKIADKNDTKEVNQSIEKPNETAQLANKK